MKTRIYLIIIGILLVTISCVQKNKKSDQKEIVNKKTESQKRPLADYKSQKLVTFYKDYGDEISDFTIVHTNEIFNAIIFYTKEKRAYVVELDTTITHHPNPKEKIGKNLEFNQFGIDNSIIKYIEFK
ncbi:hypothetical protein [Polaribacter ponticola]|uniref:Uncharacterized protein n=1 Tax=Polaribacter ponticola TaxID=2978475 RepID=A0ABT5SD24_9FLAO|nr:hypothetical protein [Polaribacter sp. MSW5]MDD7915331.1 hypothetical protein [Polaribacter sp. MSW5]